VNGFLRRLAMIGSAGALAAGLGTGAAVLTAAPAFAATGPCSDVTIVQPTPAHSLPSDSSGSVLLSSGTTVHGSCNYENNTSESRWYMQIYYGSGERYIWVQRLEHGSAHNCDYNGTVTEINDPHNNVCPLYPYSG
jgi:hypothetical protein